MPALIELDDGEGMLIVSHHQQQDRNEKKRVSNRKVIGKGSILSAKNDTDSSSRNQKIAFNQFSTRRNVGEKKDSYKIIANSIYVDANWNEYLENSLIMNLISQFLELKDLLQCMVYVSKSWQDFVLEKFSEKFKEQYELENELYFYRKLRIDVGTSDFMDSSQQQEEMEDEEDSRRVKFSVEKEGREIIPPELKYDRNSKGKFLFSPMDKPERYALFVRYTCLNRAREAIQKYINYLLDEYSQCSGKDAKNFRQFIGWNDWNVFERKNFHQSLLEQAKMWYAFSYSCEISKKLTELFDMSKDVVIFSGTFANFDIEIRVEKSGKTRVVFDDVAQFEEFPMKTMENYNSITWFDEERFVSKQQNSKSFDMVD